MAAPYLLGNAIETQQVTEYVFGGSFEATDVINVTINSRTISIIAGSTSIPTILDNVVAALEASTDDEFAAIAWTEDGADVLTATGQMGIPFVCTIATTETGGGAGDDQEIDGGLSSTGTNVTTASGPNDWSNTTIWSAGAVPADTDHVLLANSDVSLLYGLSQASIQLASLKAPASYSGRVGLKKYGSAQTLPTFKATASRYLRIDSTILRIGDGEGNGTPQFYWDAGAVQFTGVINKTAAPDSDEQYAVKIIGTHASNVLTVNRGFVGVADEAGQVATILTLKVGQIVSPSDTRVYCGPGVTLGALLATGGCTLLHCAATTVTVDGGQVVLEGDAAYGTILCNEGICEYKSSGTITQLTGQENGTIDFRKDLQPRTVTDCDMYPGSVLEDPYGTITFTNPVTIHGLLSEMKFNTTSPVELVFA